MDQELISKKELLETFGISYGALYGGSRVGGFRSVVPAAVHVHGTGNLLPPGPDLPAGPADSGQQGAPDPGRAGGQSGGEGVRPLWPGESSLLKRHMAAREFPLEEVRRAVVAEGQRQEDVLELLKEVTL